MCYCSERWLTGNVWFCMEIRKRYQYHYDILIPQTIEIRLGCVDHISWNLLNKRCNAYQFDATRRHIVVSGASNIYDSRQLWPGCDVADCSWQWHAMTTALAHSASNTVLELGLVHGEDGNLRVHDARSSDHN